MQVPYESEGVRHRARKKGREREREGQTDRVLNGNKRTDAGACLFPTPLNVFSPCTVCLFDNWHYLIVLINSLSGYMRLNVTNIKCDHLQ